MSFTSLSTNSLESSPYTNSNKVESFRCKTVCYLWMYTFPGRDIVVESWILVAICVNSAIVLRLLTVHTVLSIHLKVAFWPDQCMLWAARSTLISSVVGLCDIYALQWWCHITTYTHARPFRVHGFLTACFLSCCTSCFLDLSNLDHKWITRSILNQWMSDLES